MADVGTIWVKIGADASELDRVLSGSKAELGKFASDMQAVGMRLAAVGAALTGPLLLGLKGAVDLGDQLDEMSQKTGVSTETLSKFSLAAKKNSVDLGGLAAGFKYLAVHMTDALKAGTPQAKMFSDMGIAVTEASGKLRPMESVMLDVAERFASMADGAEKTNLAVELFGRSGMELIPFLNKGKTGLKEAADEAERLGIVLTPRAAKAAAELADRMDELKAAFQGVFIQLANSLGPALQSITKYVTDFTSSIGGLLRSVPILGTTFGGLTIGIGSMALSTGTALIVVGNFIRSLNTITSATKIAVLGIGALSAGLMGIAYIGGDAIISYSKYMKILGQESEVTGRKISGFQKVWESVNAWAVRAAGGFNAVKAAQQAEAKYMAEGVPQIRGVAEAFKELAGNLKEGYVTASYAAYNAQVMLLQSMGIFLPAIKTQEEIWADIAAAEDKAKEAAQKYADFLSSIGVSTFANTAAKVRELTEGKAKLTDQFRDGLIPASDYAQGLKEIDRQIKSLTETMMTMTIPAARKFSAEIWSAKPALEDAAYSTMTFDESIQAIADSMGYSAATVIRELYNIRAAFLQTLGIILPRWEDIPKAAGQAARETHDYFAGLFSGLARDFGNTVKVWLEGLTTFEEFAKSVFDNIKNAFFTMLGQAATAWITELIDPMMSSAKAAGESVTASMESAAAGAAGAASSMGTMIATAIGSALGTLVGTLIAGGGDNSDITYWLKPISERAQEIRDWLFINGQEHLLTIRQILGDISAKTQEVRDSINGGLIAVLNAILSVERDTYKALTATHTIHVIDDAVLDSQRDAAASLAGIARTGLPPGLADSTGRGMTGMAGLADSALYKRSRAEGHTFVYAPQVSAIDAAGVMKFVRGPMREEFVRMVRDNAGGVTKALAVETGKYTAR